MTSPNVSTRSRRGPDEDSLTDWVMLHKREVSWAVIVLAVIILGIWYYERSRTLRAQRAESQYYQARQALAAGNPALAISDLQKVVSRYGGTPGGTQAALTLAQAFYDQKKFKEGIDALKKAEGNAPDEFKAALHVLEAAGYEELKDFSAAAAQYKVAAQTTRFPADKADYQAGAARNYMAAGKPEEARAIWAELAKDETGPAAAEAKVRLGEVVAKPMSI
jgi:predicted negative regulator of RcsB-dependent stress response